MFQVRSVKGDQPASGNRPPAVCDVCHIINGIHGIGYSVHVCEVAGHCFQGVLGTDKRDEGLKHKWAIPVICSYISLAKWCLYSWLRDRLLFIEHVCVNYK